MKDFANKDWLRSENPAYDCVNVTSHDRLARAVGWLRERHSYRGDSHCLHRYTNAAGELTKVEAMK